jgi:predicted metalloprotease with PDZ domain
MSRHKFCSSMNLSRLLVALLLCLAWSAAMARADDAKAKTKYVLQFDDARNHVVDVRLEFRAANAEQCELMMATWTPGSYLIREYARNVDQITAVDAQGETLSLEKMSKNRWSIRGKNLDQVVVHYRVYCREMSVRTNFVDREFAVLNGAPTFIVPTAYIQDPIEVEIKLPTGWRQSVTALDAKEGAAAGCYQARGFDHLVDSPIVIGNPEVQSFNVNGIEHVLVNVGGNGLWDAAKATGDVAKIVAEQQALWKKVPYRKYYFLNVIGESGGGLEHDESTLMLTSRWAFRRPEDYKKWLGLVSHEFFHAWNIRTLRPKALVDYDYENENYFPSLWIAEGITSYYDDLSLVRSGVISQDEYLSLLSKQIERLEATPGRLQQSLRDASHDAWIKYYRQDEHSRNTQISYYIKGAVVAFLLDARIRELTQNKKSLDDVMREVYRRYSGDRGYTETEFRKVASKVAGEDLSDWFTKHVDEASELDYQPALDWLGLRLEGWKSGEGEEVPEEGKEVGETEVVTPWLGAGTREENGKLVVTNVTVDSPAYETGMNVDDELIAVNRFRVQSSTLDRVLGQFAGEPEVTLTLSRRGELLELPLQIRGKPEGPSKLTFIKDASKKQQTSMADWLHASEK